MTVAYQLLNAHILLAKNCPMVTATFKEVGRCHPPVHSEGEKKEELKGEAASRVNMLTWISWNQLKIK